MYRRIKKHIYFVLMLIVFILSACKNNNISKNDIKKINVMATIFPIYDMTKELCKGVDGVDIKLLMDSGIDLHNFTPTSKDIIDIGNSDLFVYIGGESDKWVPNVFSSLNYNKDKEINLMENLKTRLKEEELKEGMEAEEENDESCEEIEYDEHIWLSVKNAKEIVRNIYEKLNKILINKGYDENIINVLKMNYDNYILSLDNLDNKFTELTENAIKNGKEMTLLFADRFPFKYFVDDYNLDYFAAFKGCSAESEASFKTIMFLSNKCKELNLKYIFALDGSDKKIANTVISNTDGMNIEILTLDSLQSKTSKDIDKGVTYLSVMSDNYDVLKRYFE